MTRIGGVDGGAGEQPDRKQGLLTNLRERLEAFMLDQVEPAYQATGDALFDFAEKAGSNDEQSRAFTAMTLLRNSRESFIEILCGELDTQFAEMARGKQVDWSEETDEGEAPKLSLVDEDTLSRTLISDEFVARCELKHMEALYGLNQRVTVLNGGRKVGNETNPLAPAAMARCLSKSAEAFDFETRFQIQLLAACEKCVKNSLEDFYRSVNEQLIEAGILPNLKSKPKPVKKSGADREPDGDKKADSRAEKEDGGSSQPTPDAGQAPVDQGSYGRRATDVKRRATDFGRRGSDRTASDPAAIVGQIHSLLQKLKPAGAARSVHPEAPPRSLDQILSDFQRKKQAAAGQSFDLNDLASRLKERLEQKKLSVAPDQDRIINIMGMVYDHAGTSEEVTPPAARLLEKLKVPLLRVALADPNFMTDSTHPARKFLDAIADAGDAWLGDEPEKSPVYQRMRGAVDDVHANYDGDFELFRRLIDELSDQIQASKRKADLLEKRQVAASKGKERLAVARRAAHDEIDRLVTRYEPSTFGQSLLKEAWADYLALLYIREGPDSESWSEAVRTGGYLAMALRKQNAPPLAKKLKKQFEPSRQALSRGLSQVGFAKSEIDDIGQRVEESLEYSMAKYSDHSAPEPPAYDQPVATRESAVEKPAPEPKVVLLPLSQEAQAELIKLRVMPFGSWFEYMPRNQTSWVRRKLSWFSPMSGHCLCVDGLGHPDKRLDSMNALAQAFADERARVWEPPKLPFLERCLTAVKSRLQALVGSSEASHA